MLIQGVHFVLSLSAVAVWHKQPESDGNSENFEKQTNLNCRVTRNFKLRRLQAFLCDEASVRATVQGDDRMDTL